MTFLFTEPIHMAHSHTLHAHIWAWALSLLFLAGIIIGCLQVLTKPQKHSNIKQEALPQEDRETGDFEGMASPEHLAGELILERQVGRGRYGKVFSAKFGGPGYQNVAVKLFESFHKCMWLAERRFYAIPKIQNSQHNNILKFIGAQDLSLELRLVTELHQNGSLSDYLQIHCVTWEELLTICLGIAQGAEFLHTIEPIIVHRDIKSENILIKDDLTPCLADFGLHVDFTRKIDRRECSQVSLDNSRLS